MNFTVCFQGLFWRLLGLSLGFWILEGSRIIGGTVGVVSGQLRLKSCEVIVSHESTVIRVVRG